jgi:hypothetical protein
MPNQAQNSKPEPGIKLVHKAFYQSGFLSLWHCFELWVLTLGFSFDLRIIDPGLNPVKSL